MLVIYIPVHVLGIECIYMHWRINLIVLPVMDCCSLKEIPKGLGGGLLSSEKTWMRMILSDCLYYLLKSLIYPTFLSPPSLKFIHIHISSYSKYCSRCIIISCDLWILLSFYSNIFRNHTRKMFRTLLFGGCHSFKEIDRSYKSPRCYQSCCIHHLEHWCCLFPSQEHSEIFNEYT